MEILQWLPAKTLCKLKTVSKTFLKLISDPFIQTLHAKHVKTGISVINIVDSKFEIIPIDHDVFGVPTESLLFLTKYSKQILTTFHGLIFFKSFLNDFRVINPVNNITSWLNQRKRSYEIICAIGKISSKSRKVMLEFWRYLSEDMSWEYLAEVI